MVVAGDTARVECSCLCLADSPVSFEHPTLHDDYVASCREELDAAWALMPDAQKAEALATVVQLRKGGASDALVRFHRLRIPPTIEVSSSRSPRALHQRVRTSQPSSAAAHADIVMEPTNEFVERGALPCFAAVHPALDAAAHALVVALSGGLPSVRGMAPCLL
jgi:hypothetical protein